MHTRGRRILISGSLIGVGTTHAHAGQTTVDPNNGYQRRNHPCTRGADIRDPTAPLDAAEPPMHTRGRPSSRMPAAAGLGTTHAHAGQTSSCCFVYGGGWNHPCTRGADSPSGGHYQAQTEPPMHTRGRRAVSIASKPSDGTTHAHAGQTPSPTKWPKTCRNHPCTRGADAC